MVIEAACELMEVKRELFKRLDAVVPEGALLASNTSALPISDLAAATRRPARVVGTHFFNPVPAMPLVELVTGRQTDPEVLRRARRFAQQLGKLPVTATDRPGFIVNRLLCPYLMEAVRLLVGGASREAIDEAMLEFGMVMGPLRVLDEIGLDVALDIARNLEQHFGEASSPPEALQQMVREGRLGRKTGQGFFTHGAPDVAKAATAASAAPPRASTAQATATLSQEELQQRMVFPMLNEGAGCVQEAVVEEPDDVDFAMVLGVGFPAFRGGPLRYADSLGAAQLVQAMEKLAAQAGARFAPCVLLRSFAAEQRKFYPR
jgi:3-hydroxyacyl-CoA dehydrogenase/enoyl-CoA hydratase/3-hydroxybutyryl-CoA epimerase